MLLAPMTTGRGSDAGGGRKLAARLCVLLLSAFTPVGCDDPPTADLHVALVPATSGTPAFIRVTGLSDNELGRIRQITFDEHAWQALLRVGVAAVDGPAITGRYIVAREGLQFHPRFPFDPGRAYVVRFDPARLPYPRDLEPIEQTVALPAAAASAPTSVAAISPSGGVWPENLLRFYIHFSAPMSRTSALGFVRLEDDTGQVVEEAFLPLDVDLWNDTRTRYTVFFDPGRVKRGILPNVEAGRALEAGRRYTIVVDPGWRDANGQPLASAFRYAFSAAPAVERAIAINDWRIAAPAANGRTALTVSFPWALDTALLQRALGVARSDGTMIPGEVTIGEGEQEWRFVPGTPWTAGAHQLVVLSLLEDPAGNRVGRAFEVEMLSAPREAAPERVTRAFDVR
jgi:hypothetical protein